MLDQESVIPGLNIINRVRVRCLFECLCRILFLCTITIVIVIPFGVSKNTQTMSSSNAEELQHAPKASEDSVAASLPQEETKAHLFKLYSSVGNPQNTVKWMWDWDKDVDKRIDRSFAFDHPTIQIEGDMDHWNAHPLTAISRKLDRSGLPRSDTGFDGGVPGVVDLLGPWDQSRFRHTTEDGLMYDHIYNGRLASFDYLKGTASEKPWMHDFEKVHHETSGSPSRQD